ncbi:peptidylprolyl isomerase [Limimaricola pyoseonensis]|uniref:Parvulin-like PPIase n=1 Tax=Limimaricola pyoseonensis TaxID=521013 RepID=A0A1G7GWC3_9RHOB|nr:peptidylprolyl isomerase [Limimaricola pyoseonensis]SDE92456.1 peptidyl-prolyl cis-trans isomerase D [Limimaricola pyoseonensis]
MAEKKGNRVFVWIILILLFVGLIGFGATGLTGHATRLGTVGEKELEVQAYANALQSRIRAFESQTGEAVSLAQAQQIGLDRAVLGRLVTERVLDNEADRLGLSVGDERVREQVLQIGAFQGLDGQFDRDAYREALRRNGLTVSEFETGLREGEARALLESAVVNGIAAPQPHVDAMIDFLMARRDITWAPVTLSPAAAAAPAGDGPRVLLPEITLDPEIPAPSEAEIQARYEAAPEAYTAPERREITYAWLRPETVSESIEVPEEDVRALYEQRIDDYVQEERRLVERLVYPNAEAATEAKARLDAGEAEFEALVEARGLDLSDADLGDVARGDLGDAAEPVFAAEAGEVVGPVETGLGPALFRVNAVLGAEEVSFEEAAPDLRGELARAMARREIQDATDEIEDLLAGGAALEDLAERTGMELGSLSWSEGETDGIAAYAPFRQAAAVAEQGDFPELIGFEDGGVFALRLDGVTEPALRPLDEVREQVVADIMAETRQTMLTERAEALAAEIAGGASFEAAGLAPRDVDALTRRDFVEGTAPGFVTEIFEMEEGETRAIALPEGAAVVRLDATAAPEADDPAVAAERQAIEQRLAGSIAQDIYAAYATEVQANTEIRIDDAAIQAVHSSFR